MRRTTHRTAQAGFSSSVVHTADTFPAGDGNEVPRPRGRCVGCSHRAPRGRGHTPLGKAFCYTLLQSKSQRLEPLAVTIGLLALVHTTRLTGGYDFIHLDFCAFFAFADILRVRAL